MLYSPVETSKSSYSAPQPPLLFLCIFVATMAGSHSEKAPTETVPTVCHSAIIESISDVPVDEYSAEEQRRIIRRIDYRLVTILGILYCASLMDRTNLSSASIAGLVLNFPNFLHYN